jgi:HEAT repeat protein
VTATAAIVQPRADAGAAATAIWQPAPAGPTDAAPPQDADLARILQRDLQQLAAKLNDQAARQEERDEAARRLVSRRTPEARRVVANALVNLNPAGQLAAARALADDPPGDPALIDPLFAALGVNPRLTEAAARALASYRANPDVLTRLIDFVRRRPANDPVRLPVIHVLGMTANRRAAEFLVSIVGNPEESPAARRDAAAALADLTGITENGQDPVRWQRWWDVNGRKGDDQFAADILAQRSTQFEQLRQRVGDLSAELERIANEQYRLAPPAQRGDVLLGFMRSAEPAVRAAGASIVKFDALGGRAPAAPVREQLRDMIGDSSARVRLAVADALATINDADALEPLMAQLAQEPDAAVRERLAAALGPIEDVRAAPLLLAMLNDPSAGTAGAAADALAQMGRKIAENDPALATRVARALRQTMEARAMTPETADLRAKLLAAMAPLKQDELAETFKVLLDLRRGEGEQVRRLALRGMGELKNPQYAAIIVTSSLNDNSDQIRLEAVQALAKNPALPDYAETLRPFLDPQQERSEQVRDAAWTAIQSALPALPKAQLVVWTERLKKDPEKRILALLALADRELQDRDEDDLASTRLDIGTVYMQLREYARAANYFGLALEYKKAHGMPGVVITNLIEQRLKALLGARDYAGAASFAAQVIAEAQSNQQSVGPIIRDEAQRLADSGESKAASELIGQAKLMKPPLADRYVDELQKVEQKLGAQNNAVRGGGPTSSTAASGP